jgi:2-dehydropantoate 2-reductase
MQRLRPVASRLISVTMNICVMGAGAIGGWVAARLAGAGHRVLALTSRGPLAEIRISEGGVDRTVALVHPNAPADLLVLAVKAPALPALAPAAAAHVAPDAIVLPLLNGVPWWFLPNSQLASVDPTGDIGRFLPSDHVVGSVVHASCSRPGPGQVAVHHVDKLILGEPGGGPSTRVEQLRSMFQESSIPADASADVRRAIWYKLWGNATVNPLAALTRAPADQLLADPALRAFMAEAMTELAAVGAAIGCAITESSEDRMAVTARLGSFKPSMLQDVEAGRQIELEALVGAPREIAARHGVPTPALDRIYAMTRLMGERLSLL